MIRSCWEASKTIICVCLCSMGRKVLPCLELESPDGDRGWRQWNLRIISKKIRGDQILTFSQRYSVSALDLVKRALLFIFFAFHGPDCHLQKESEFLLTGIRWDPADRRLLGRWNEKFESLDKSGQVFIVGDCVYLRPEQVARIMETVLPLFNRSHIWIPGNDWILDYGISWSFSIIAMFFILPSNIPLIVWVFPQTFHWNCFLKLFIETTN